MNKIYDIITPFNRGQTHSVVAKNMATAEQLFLKHYPGVIIQEIKLHAEYVILPEETKNA